MEHASPIFTGTQPFIGGCDCIGTMEEVQPGILGSVLSSAGAGDTAKTLPALAARETCELADHVQSPGTINRKPHVVKTVVGSIAVPIIYMFCSCPGHPWFPSDVKVDWRLQPCRKGAMSASSQVQGLRMERSTEREGYAALTWKVGYRPDP